MADVVDKATRSRMMSGIRAKNTQPEMVIRRSLHSLGFRFRLHRTDIPGRPDLVFPRFHAVMFVHGCFWHGHDCQLFKVPSTRPDFWAAKIARNRLRDSDVGEQVRLAGWRQLTIWECAMRGPTRLPHDALVEEVVVWLTGGLPTTEIKGGA